MRQSSNIFLKMRTITSTTEKNVVRARKEVQKDDGVLYLTDSDCEGLLNFPAGIYTPMTNEVLCKHREDGTQTQRNSNRCR